MCFLVFQSTCPLFDFNICNLISNTCFVSNKQTTIALKLILLYGKKQLTNKKATKENNKEK